MYRDRYHGTKAGSVC